MPDLTASLVLNFDGSVEPMNPGGIATYGWVICDASGAELRNGYGVICSGPTATNNRAEYCALGRGLRHLTDASWTGDLLIRGDSQLVINQVEGKWRCKAEHLKKLLNRVWELLELVPDHQLQWIPRDQNERADELSRMAYQKELVKLPAETSRLLLAQRQRRR